MDEMNVVHTLRDSPGVSQAFRLVFGWMQGGCMILLCRRAFTLSIENRIDVSCDCGWDFGVRVLIEKTRNAWKLKEHTEKTRT